MLRKFKTKHLFFAFLPWSLFWTNLKINTSLDSQKLKLVFVKSTTEDNLVQCSNIKKTKDNVFVVTLSESNIARQKGLSYRTKPLKKDEGMLFIFSRKNDPQISCPGFWMKDTYIPLDLGFISQNGTLFDLHTMPVEEHPNNPTRSYLTKKPCVAAIETASEELAKQVKAGHNQICLDWY